MRKRLPYLALALLFGLASSVLIGGRVRAAYPLFYDGSVTWAVGRRDTRQGTDFNYSTYTESLPVYGEAGRIHPELCGVPTNRSNTTYSTFPSYIAVKSRQLRQNGGYLYYGFIIAYSTSASNFTSLSFTSSQIAAYLSLSGSLSYARSNGYSLTQSQVTATANPNTTMSVHIPPTYSVSDLHMDTMTRFDGSNFPKVAYMIDSAQGLDSYGLAYTTQYEFGDSASAWVKANFYQARIYIEPNTGSLQDTVWIDLTNAIRGSFKSITQNVSFYDESGVLIDYVNAYKTNCIYLCPVFCYATSSDSYEDTRYYLANIMQSLSELVSQNPPSPGVLESYAALGSQAREDAARAASQMAAAVPSYDAADYDVDTYVDSHALDQFKQTVGFLSHSKILPIVMLVFILATVAYVFFGKKGG